MITIFPASYDTKIKQGSTYTRKITVKNKNTGILTDFTGYKARMDIKQNVQSQPLVSLTTENGGIVLGTGTIEIKISPSQSKNLKYEQCVYDLDLISSSGDVYTYLEGTFYVSLEVTL